MNKLKCITTSFVLLTAVFISCTTEPYGGVIVDPANLPAANVPPATNIPVSSVIGNYILTAHNTSTATDLNLNGTASVNQMLETACFNNSTLTINANGTFSVLDNYADIATVNGVDSVSCGTGNDAGTWTLSGNVLTLTTIGITVVQTAIFENNTLKVNVLNTEFLNIVNGNLDFVTGNVQLIFTKQ